MGHRRGIQAAGSIQPAATRLQGWGRSIKSTGSVSTGIPGPADVTGAAPRGILARGGGQGYGDAALNAGGRVLQLPPDCGDILLDPTSGIAEVDAAVTMRRLLTVTLDSGWSPPVLPGTGRATLGGAVAADVHGKNHAAAGSFGTHLLRLTLLTGAGETLHLLPGDPRFGCTVGGLGLTGVILRARLQLSRSSSRWARTARHRAQDLDAVLALLSDHEHAVAWVDGHRSGAGLGRGLVDATTLGEGPSATGGTSRRTQIGGAATHVTGWVGRLPGPGVMYPELVSAFNAAVWARPVRGSRVSGVEEALFPLSKVDGWPELFGRRGLVQYQFAVPTERVDVLEDTLATLARRGCPPALVTIKRLGDPLPGSPLSFPIRGWTMALDLPVAAPGLGAVLDRLDVDLAEAGGRVYLVKDSRLRPELLSVMYPQIEHWRSVRDELDPDRRFRSDLDRRLDLVLGSSRARRLHRVIR